MHGGVTTEVTVLTSHECGHCEHAVGTIRDELAGLSDVRLETVDVTENPEVVERMEVRCCPSVLLDGALAFVGVPTRTELVRAVEDAAAGRGVRMQTARRYEGPRGDPE